jgi:hypothetical protein
MAYYGEDIEGTSGFGSTYLRDYTHAAKTFRPGSFDLAPKFKFLFHTFFDINPSAYDRGIATGDNFGVLVKTVKLPSYSIKTHEMNQYNRKRIVQTKINYDPINITFHDDNVNTITKLWDAYYTYYYKDSTNLNGVLKGTRGSDVASSQPGAGASNQDYNSRNVYDADLSGNNNWGYVGESYNNDTNKVPFFRNITIFGLNRHTFTAYTLINPMITKMDHDTYSYADGQGTMEIKLDISYETVVYNEGVIDGQTPDNIISGFGLDAYYDKRSSPNLKRTEDKSLAPGKGTYVNAAGGFVNNMADDPYKYTGGNYI